MSETGLYVKPRRVLFVAYHYPPTISTGVPGSMRTIKFVRNLEGIQSHVLTRDEVVLPEGQSALAHLKLPVRQETIHRVRPWDAFKVMLSLRARLKSLLTRSGEPGASGNASVFRTSAGGDAPRNASRIQRAKDFVYDLCYFPDQAAPWIVPATLKGCQIVRRERIDTVFATGAPWSGLVVGYLVSRLTRKPFIADFRDPWVNNPFHHSKGATLDRISAEVERRIVRHAAAVSLNTHALENEFLQRYPEIDRSRFFVLPNGYDPADFDLPAHTTSRADSDILELCHTGFLYGVRDPAALLTAIRVANEELKPLGLQVRFRQIGEINLGYDVQGRYRDLLDDGSLILESPRPYKECLAALSAADVLVNVQPDTTTQIPSKLYDYLALGKPIISITPSTGALAQLVRKYDFGTAFDFSEHQPLARWLVASALERDDLRRFTGYSRRSEFDSRRIAADLAAEIDRILAEPTMERA